MFLYKWFSFFIKIFALIFKFTQYLSFKFYLSRFYSITFFNVKPFKKSVQLFILQGH